MKNLCIHPINNYILVKPLVSLREGRIHLPDQIVQKSVFAHILDVGESVADRFITKDKIVMLSSNCMRTILPNGTWIVKESDIIAIRHDIVRPFGNRIFIKRFNEEKKVGSIIIPSTHDSADQSLEGIFTTAGLVNGEKVEFPVPIGEKVKIEKWSMNLIEIDVSGDYFLSVPVKEVQYAFES